MIPRFTEFYIPVLEVLSDLNEMEVNTLIDNVAQHIGLTEEEKNITTRSGSQLRYRSNISWAITDLKQGGFIERPKRGTYVITLEGLELLEENPKNPDRDTLASKSEKFREFLEREGTRKKKEFEADESEKDSAFQPCKSVKDSTGVSLFELYQTLGILKRAKLSTVEIERKIIQLEKEKIIETHSSVLIEQLEKLASKLSVNEQINLTYRRNHSLKIEIGNFYQTFDLVNHQKKVSHKNVNRVIPEKGMDNAPESAKKKNKVSNLTKEVTSGKHQQEPTQEIKPLKSKGVWIKPQSSISFAIFGDTEPFSELFKAYGGYHCKHLKEGDAWIFLNGKEEGLRKELKGYIIEENKKASDNNILQLGKNKEIIDKYKKYLDKLKSFNFLGITGPHKPILLLAIFEQINRGVIKENKIYYTQDLEQLYINLWNQIIASPLTLGAPYPYAHLCKENFVAPNLNRSIYNFDITWNQNSLKAINYIKLDRQLFELVRDKNGYQELSIFLINRYCGRQSSTSILRN